MTCGELMLGKGLDEVPTPCSTVRNYPRCRMYAVVESAPVWHMKFRWSFHRIRVFICDAYLTDVSYQDVVNHWLEQ
jgi:hypothetical protein